MVHCSTKYAQHDTHALYRTSHRARVGHSGAHLTHSCYRRVPGTNLAQYRTSRSTCVGPTGLWRTSVPDIP
eukprot:1613587-Rhodomonas_salina.1